MSRASPYEIKELRERLVVAERERDDLRYRLFCQVKDAIALIKAVRDLEDERDRLAEALLPFADVAYLFDHCHADTRISPNIPVSYYRGARAILAECAGTPPSE